MLELEIGNDNNRLKTAFIDFKFFCENDFNKQLLISTLEKSINNKNWPMEYYSLREYNLPTIIGKDASDFFFWFIFGADLDEIVAQGLLGKESEEYIGPEKEFSNVGLNDLRIYLSYLKENYTKTLSLAKSYNVNPMGYYEAVYSHNEHIKEFNVSFLRNDGESFKMRLNDSELGFLILDATRYLEHRSNLGVSINKSNEEQLRTIATLLSRASDNIHSHIANSNFEEDKDGSS
ncbi:hypothetical protein MKX67_09010 [Cytobacillus sp. FSL W7-1323]|uniref:hypothetical protein n=1 Tax=Cytobacillus sp. FSL W7-1323 TaxID=2921700 RepID=UPI003158A008